MSFARWTVTLALFAGSITGCLSSHDDGSVRAVNLRSGEMRDFPDEESVPDGWGICTPDGECPTLVACDGLDETSCLAREDCEAIYAEALPPECDVPPGSGMPIPEWCGTLPFAGCTDGGGGVDECAPDECGPALGAPAYICPDGSVGGNTGRCLRNPDGVCGWEIRECPPTGECTPEECGPEPGIPTWTCEDGSIGGSTGRCLRGEDGVCGWEIRDCDPTDCSEVPACDFLCPPGTHNPVDEAGCLHTCECVPDEGGGSCGPDECLAYGAPDPVCPDGTTATTTCERGFDGACGWHHACGTCAESECGPPPGADPMCAGTGTSATLSCERNLEGACGWHFSCG